MSNSVVLSGYVGNIETKPIGEYKKTTFSLAVKNPGKKKGDDGETQWIPCEAWRNQADVLEKFVTKGSYVVLTGQLKTDTWEKDGEKRTKLFFVANDVDLGPKVNKDGGATASAAPAAKSAPVEDELPPF